MRRKREKKLTFIMIFRARKKVEDHTRVWRKRHIHIQQYITGSTGRRELAKNVERLSETGRTTTKFLLLLLLLFKL